MIGQRWTAWAGLAAVLLVACDRRPENPARPVPAPAASPTVSPAPASHVAPVAQPVAAPAAAAEPASSSVLLVDGNLLTFPSARLKLSRGDGNLTAILYTADPRNAIDNDYVGNSYYLVMPLDVADPQELGTAEWHLKAGSEEEGNTTEGIFLNGLRMHLQPSDIVVRFTGTPSLVQVQFMGPQERPWSDFLLFDASTSGSLPRHVQVSGSVFATVDSK